jgi:hypothetical protein
VHERIFHVSESPIERFEPRPDAQNRPRVWAIAESRLQNYLLPRDCPRVTYYASATTTPVDRAAFFSGSDAQSVVAIEQVWLPALRTARLHVHEFAPDGFVLDDAIAGYWVRADPVTPIARREVPDVVAALTARNVELRVLPSLWRLHDAVVASTLAFSIIRMRNARPRGL